MNKGSSYIICLMLMGSSFLLPVRVLAQACTISSVSSCTCPASDPINCKFTAMLPEVAAATGKPAFLQGAPFCLRTNSGCGHSNGGAGYSSSIKGNETCVFQGYYKQLYSGDSNYEVRFKMGYDLNCTAESDGWAIKPYNRGSYENICRHTITDGNAVPFHFVCKNTSSSSRSTLFWVVKAAILSLDLCCGDDDAIAACKPELKRVVVVE